MKLDPAILSLALSIVTALILAYSVRVQVLHLRAMEREQRDNSAEAKAEAERAQRMFDQQTLWAALSALIQAEIFVGRAQVSAPDRFHPLHAKLLEYVTRRMREDPLAQPGARPGEK